MGGEPTISKNVLKLLDMLNKNTKLIIDTNLSSYNKVFFDRIADFKEVIFTCSIDGYGKYCELQRRGSKWKHIEKNYFKIREQYDTVINYVMTPISIYGYCDFVKWSLKHNVQNIQYTLCQNPSIFNLNIMPIKYKKKFKHPEFNNILSNGFENLVLWQKMLEHLEKLNVDIYKLIPEWREK